MAPPFHVLGGFFYLYIYIKKTRVWRGSGPMQTRENQNENVFVTRKEGEVFTF